MPKKAYINEIHLLSQYFPLNLFLHTQKGVFPSCVHSPPFIQGFGSQGFGTERINSRSGVSFMRGPIFLSKNHDYLSRFIGVCARESFFPGPKLKWITSLVPGQTYLHNVSQKIWDSSRICSEANRGSSCIFHSFYMGYCGSNLPLKNNIGMKWLLSYFQ